MDTTRVERVATGALIGAGLALFLDLFLDWSETTVRLPALSVDTGTTGWHGWGVVAGVALAGLLLWEGSRRLAPEIAPAEAMGSALLAALVLGGVVASFRATVDVGVGPIHVATASRAWPAYLGLALAVVVAVAAVVRLAAATRPTRRAQSPPPRSPVAG